MRAFFLFLAALRQAGRGTEEAGDRKRSRQVTTYFLHALEAPYLSVV